MQEAYVKLDLQYDYEDIKVCCGQLLKTKYCPNCGKHRKTKWRIVQTLESMSSYGEDLTGLQNGIKVYKWHSWLKDMIFLSKYNPDVIFILHGIDTYDYPELFYYYFKDGKYYEAKFEIQLEPFDVEKLKDVE